MRRVVLLLVSCYLIGCSPREEAPTHGLNDTATTPEQTSPMTKPPTQLTIQDLKVGSGTTLKSGATAVVHYTGWLYDSSRPDNKGTQFDSSRPRNEPFRFAVGQGSVIAGWDEGVVDMALGGQRRLIIPPEKGYGARGAGSAIPGNATLVFDIELLEIQ
jgi:FKBP-type peptidyl-prolyl cis-trans isomerase FkpA